MIRAVSYFEILDAPNAAHLMAEYAKDCMVPDPEPQRDMYEAMEKAGMLHCFGAFVEGNLIGFGSVLTGPMLHHGKLLASVESIFVLAEHRDSGAGNALISELERAASILGCDRIVASTRIGSAMEKVMSRKPGWGATHTAFTKVLA